MNDAKSSLAIYLLDTVKGSVLYHTIHENVGTGYPVYMVQCENWIVYHYWMHRDEGMYNGKGFVVVVLELYESAIENDRIVK